MWGRTRDLQVRGPNELLLDADEDRLADWRDWLKRAGKQPDLVWQATPVCGAWQLQFMVHNFAPAGQKVLAEQQEPDGTWRELASRFTHEFRALSARPKSRLKREFTVPLDLPEARLRIAVRGVGQVGVSHVSMTDGVQSRRGRNYHVRKIIGERVTHLHFPHFDREARQATTLKITFRRSDKNNGAV
jgi:hypothetical protein